MDQNIYKILPDADLNSFRDGRIVMHVPPELLDPEFYPLQPGDRVIVAEMEELTGFTGTVEVMFSYRLRRSTRAIVIVDAFTTPDTVL